MEKRFTICASLVDSQRDERRDDFFVLIDTIANRTYIYQLEDDLSDPGENAVSKKKKLFGKDPDYRITIKSEFLIRLVDELGGIDYSGFHINGAQAMEEVHNGSFGKIIEAIAQTLGKKNLLLAVPNLLNVLNSTYETDLSLIEAVKTFIGEIRELDDWKIELVKVNKENIGTYQKLL